MSKQEWTHQELQKRMMTDRAPRQEEHPESRVAHLRQSSGVASHLFTALIAVLMTLLVLLAVHWIVFPQGEGIFHPSLFRQDLVFAEDQEAEEGATTAKKPVPIASLFEKNEASLYELDKLEKVLRLIRSEYYEEKQDAELLQAMISGMLSELGSPYTFYLSAEDNKAVQDSNRGRYSGIGAAVIYEDKQFIISEIYDKAPALEAGLEIGDVILEVNGRKAKEFASASVLATEVRGEAGTTVELKIYRPRKKREMDLTITRGDITTSNLIFEMIEEGIGYIKINQFNSGVSDNFARAMETLQRQGAKTFIFDLRNNGGGYASEVISMLDYLLPKDTLVASTKGREYGKDFEERWETKADARVPEEMRYTILINKYTASASELFAGCLRDYEKAQIIGETSLGKGVGTNHFELGDGSAVQITTFHYYLPNGQCVDGDGLTPDIEEEIDEDYAGKPLLLIPRKDDRPFQKALELAREEIK